MWWLRMEKLNTKSINFSCRIPTDTFLILEKESKSKSISINSLINSILNNYVSLERHSKDILLISLTQRTVKKIFEFMDEKNIDKLSNEVGGIVQRELALLKFGELTFENLLKSIDINASRYGSVVSSYVDPYHRLCIHHNLGINFSKFLAFTHEVMAQKLSLVLRITNCDDNIICMEIKEPEGEYFEKN